MQLYRTGRRVVGKARLCVVIAAQIVMVAMGALTILPSARATAKTPEACTALQAKYPSLSGKTLVNAVNAHTPGYEALDPDDPNKYVGFDIDLGEAIGDCLGFKVTYKPVTFAALLTTLEAGQADIVISDIYATTERAKAADFVTYLKVYDGVLVAKGTPRRSMASTCQCAARRRPRTLASSKYRSFRRLRRNVKRWANQLLKSSFTITTRTAFRRSSRAAPTPTSMT
jgi:polar amino acid transport system substrate-binding protein